MSLRLKVLNGAGKELACAAGENELYLVYAPAYEEGDSLVVESDEPGRHLQLQLEDTIPPAMVYLAGTSYRLAIPFGEKRVSYSPRSFTGDRHVLSARYATAGEIAMRRNLAFNPLDCHENNTLYPHASANVETRGEAVFAARNAIDGVKANHSHGEWPYASWGINRDPNARLQLDFGRKVRLDKLVVYLRADFPHDAWWERMTVSFSDGSQVEIPLVKTGEAQAVELEPREVEWLAIDRLVKAEDPSPFPALTQIEAYGVEA